MPRLFTALEIPRDAALSLSLLRGGLPGARWIDVENYHLTCASSAMSKATSPTRSPMRSTASAARPSR